MSQFAAQVQPVMMIQGQDALFTARVTIPEGKSLSDNAKFTFSLPISSNAENSSYESLICYMYKDDKTPIVVSTDKNELSNDREKGVATVTVAVSTPLIKYDKNFTVGCKAKAAQLADGEEDMEQNCLFSITDSADVKLEAEYVGNLMKNQFASTVIDRNDKLTIHTQKMPVQTSQIRVYGVENLHISDFFATDCLLTIDKNEPSKVVVTKNLDDGYLYYSLPAGITEENEIRMVCDFAQSPISFSPKVWEYPSLAHVEGVDKDGQVIGFNSVVPTFARNSEDDEETSAAISFGMATLLSATIVAIASLCL